MSTCGPTLLEGHPISISLNASQADRATRIGALVAERAGLSDTLGAETTPLDANDRWWVWKCPTVGCPGLLHVAGYAAEKHALFVVCDGTCAKTFLR